jgi:hypothetical protein
VDRSSQARDAASGGLLPDFSRVHATGGGQFDEFGIVCEEPIGESHSW